MDKEYILVHHNEDEARAKEAMTVKSAGQESSAAMTEDSTLTSSVTIRSSKPGIPLEMEPVRKSMMELVEECDNFPYKDGNESYYSKITSSFYGFGIEGSDLHGRGYAQPVYGFVPFWVAEKMDFFTINKSYMKIYPDFYKYNEYMLKHAKASRGESEEEPGKGLEEKPMKKDKTVIIPYENEIINAQLVRLRNAKAFKVLEGWRNELYPVLGSKKDIRIERAGAALFGIVTHGVHMTAYTKTKEGMKIWVPRRAASKQTYGGMLDNSVAGGITAGESAFESLVREAAEEASLPEDLVRRDAIACGSVSYFHIRDGRAGGETGLMQPEIQYVYEMELAADVIPKPGDNEVEAFYLLTVEEVRKALSEGQFKPNCALVMIDFFVRHGFINFENEKNLNELVTRMHRKLPFPTSSFN